MRLFPDFFTAWSTLLRRAVWRPCADLVASSASSMRMFGDARRPGPRIARAECPGSMCFKTIEKVGAVSSGATCCDVLRQGRSESSYRGTVATWLLASRVSRRQKGVPKPSTRSRCRRIVGL